MFGYQSFFPAFDGSDAESAPSSFSGAQPPPKRLTYEQILAHLQPPSAPEAPAPYGGFGDLPADQQRGGKLDALWAGLAALSSGLGSGRWGEAAAEGTSAIQGIRENAVRRGNAQQEAGYQKQLAATQQKAEQERAKQQAAALAGMYDRATANEDPAGPFAQQAAAAAQRGDMSALEKMASPETQSQRAQAKARGLNPDAWDTIEQLKATLKDKIAKQSLEALSGPEAAAAAAKAKAEQDARLPGEMKLKLAPSYQAPAQYEPLDRIAARTELVESIQDKHAAARSGGVGGIKGRLGQAPNGVWGWISPPDPSNPGGRFAPIDGQPLADGKLRYFAKDGVQYVQNADHPELGAVEVRTYDAGEEGAPSMKTLRGASAPPKAAGARVSVPGDPHPDRPLQQRVSDVEAAVGRLSPEERATAAQLLQSMLPRDVVAGIRRARAGQH